LLKIKQRADDRVGVGSLAKSLTKRTQIIRHVAELPDHHPDTAQFQFILLLTLLHFSSQAPSNTAGQAVVMS